MFIWWPDRRRKPETIGEWRITLETIHIIRHTRAFNSATSRLDTENNWATSHVLQSMLILISHTTNNYNFREKFYVYLSVPCHVTAGSRTFWRVHFLHYAKNCGFDLYVFRITPPIFSIHCTLIHWNVCEILCIWVYSSWRSGKIGSVPKRWNVCL